MLKGGEVIELMSDLGGGKTTFTQGLAAGMGSRELVSSPSFTLSNEYRSARLTLKHYDFYRLNDAGILRQELQDWLADTHAVVVVEWADIVRDVLPPDRVTILFKNTGINSRMLTLTCPASKQYLVSAIQKG